MNADITINLCKGQMGASDEYLLRIEDSQNVHRVNFVPLTIREAEVLSKFFYLDLPKRGDECEEKDDE